MVTKDQINPNKLPTVYFNCYVKYFTRGLGPYVVGLNSSDEANKFVSDNSHLSNVEIRQEYPWELILLWEKEKKKK